MNLWIEISHNYFAVHIASLWHETVNQTSRFPRHLRHIAPHTNIGKFHTLDYWFRNHWLVTCTYLMSHVGWSCRVASFVSYTHTYNAYHLPGTFHLHFSGKRECSLKYVSLIDNFYLIMFSYPLMKWSLFINLSTGSLLGVFPDASADLLK